MTKLTILAYGVAALTAKLHLDVKGDAISCEGNAETSKYQDRAKVLSENARFRDWLIYASSGTLLVRGNQSMNSISPMSIMAAVLLKSLSRIPTALVLNFFCDLHT